MITLEENSVYGGFGDSVRRALSDTDDGKPAFGIISLGVKDAFVKHGSLKRQREENGLDEKSVAAAAERLLRVLSDDKNIKR